MAAAEKHGGPCHQQNRGRCQAAAAGSDSLGVTLALQTVLVRQLSGKCSLRCTGSVGLHSSIGLVCHVTPFKTQYLPEVRHTYYHSVICTNTGKTRREEQF